MVTAVVLTKNEEKNLVDCFEGLSFCDEILVIDDGSQDRTEEIAKRFKAKFIKHNLNNNFSSQRNFALEKASNDWVLFVDADERISRELGDEITKAVSVDKFDGYYLKAKFVLNFILRQGFMDGLPGLVFAIMMSFHSFLVRSKLWQLNQKKN